MSKRAVFIKDVKFDNGPLIPKGTEGPVTDVYYCVKIKDKELCLPEYIIEEDGTLKMPFFTLDDTKLEAGTKLEITDTIVAVDYGDGIAHVSKDDVLIKEE